MGNKVQHYFHLLTFVSEIVVARDLFVCCLKKLFQHQVLFGDGYTVTEYESKPNALEKVDFSCLNPLIPAFI
jgi:hypothetical protein